MELTNEFEVDLPVLEAWKVLTDVERIAPCMPGAELHEVDGDDYKGVVKVKVGPITAQYKGSARFVEKDSSSHHAVLRAEGRETRGQGNASATITASLEPSAARTRVSLTTDLHITGKVAQFGRGVLADVSNKLLEQFVRNLETTVLAASPNAAPADGADPPAPAAPHVSPGPPDTGGPAPVDLFKVAGGPVARRVAPVLGAAFVFLALVALIRRMLRD